MVARFGSGLPRWWPDAARGGAAGGLPRRHRRRDHRLVATAAARRAPDRGAPPRRRRGRRGGRSARRSPRRAAITRRSLLVRMLAGPSPASGRRSRSLCSRSARCPARSCSRRRGSRACASSALMGTPVNASEIPVGGIQTVFPEGAPAGLRLPDACSSTWARACSSSRRSRTAGAPDGYVAYSKLCTHAGCPVGLYRSDRAPLICPCHQSHVRRAPPAPCPSSGLRRGRCRSCRSSSQPDGTFVALGDFTEPVGPSFWDVNHGERRAPAADIGPRWRKTPSERLDERTGFARYAAAWRCARSSPTTGRSCSASSRCSPSSSLLADRHCS